jgi:hypothetical protein
MSKRRSREDDDGLMHRHPYCPTVRSRCADCEVGTFTIGEWYMVCDEVWAQAWADRLKPWHALDGQQILCIGCLEKRIGRTLMASDFTDAQVNNPNDETISDRLYDRLTATSGTVNGLDGLVAWAIERMIQRLPEDQRVAARERAHRTVLQGD